METPNMTAFEVKRFEGKTRQHLEAAFNKIRYSPIGEAHVNLCEAVVNCQAEESAESSKIAELKEILSVSNSSPEIQLLHKLAAQLEIELDFPKVD